MSKRYKFNFVNSQVTFWDGRIAQVLRAQTLQYFHELFRLWNFEVTKFDQMWRQNFYIFKPLA